MTVGYTLRGWAMFSRKPGALLPKQYMRGRQLVLVDIENAVGGAAIDQAAVRWAKAHIEEVTKIAAEGHVVIGTSHIGLLSVGSAWSDLRYVVGSGPDGADRALLTVLEEDIESRFGEILLVSGDGIFADRIAELAAYGLRVIVVAHPDGLSKRLRMAAHQVIYLTDHYPHGAFGRAA